MQSPIDLDVDYDQVERVLCERSLADFAKRAWHILEPSTPLKWGWALDAICLHLEAVSDGRIKRLLMNVPPGTMKSLLTSVIWPAWEWGPAGKATNRFIGTAHEESLAIRDSRKMRELIKSEWYQRLWPIELSSSSDGKREFENTKRGFRVACSFTSMTGKRGDRVILDDPINAFDANSAAKLEAARLAFTETLPTRVNNDDSAIVVIMQRLHESDTSGIILDLGLPYVHLRIPMRFEANNRCTTPIWTDPRTYDGELMFPERFSEEKVQELEQTLGTYATAGQLQQRPVQRGGALFKDEWWKFYKSAPLFKFRVIYVDAANKTKELNDYSVLQCWGVADNGIYLIDMDRGKWEAPDLLTHAKTFWAKHKPGNSVLRYMGVEDKANGTGLIQTLKRESVMPIRAIQRNIDKVSRANDCTPLIESGRVFLPDDEPFVSDLLREAAVFPNGKNDDTLDPLMDAIQENLINSSVVDYNALL
jgi:predicted phage terminase large subunit-like protein